MTKVELELLTNMMNMLQKIESGIRSGVCHTVFRHAKVNINIDLVITVSKCKI